MIAITEYRWTIEEDTTFHTTPGIGNPNSLSTNFHKSTLPLVATVASAPFSCGQGQRGSIPRRVLDGPLPCGMEGYDHRPRRRLTRYTSTRRSTTTSLFCLAMPLTV